MIFAFVPPIAAWIINCIAVYVIAATGMFALLRWHGVRTLSAFVAAMSFAYSGAMIGQLVHLGVVQGFAFIPWAALILVSLSRRLSLEPASSTWRHLARVSKPWIWGYALLWGLTFLTVAIFASPAVLIDGTSRGRKPWIAPALALVTLVAMGGFGVQRRTDTARAVGEHQHEESGLS